MCLGTRSLRPLIDWRRPPAGGAKGMPPMGRTLLRILKIICYVALGALLAGFAVLAFLGVLDICPRLDEGGISCVSPVFEVIASIAMAIVLLSVFMGLPALLALGGLIFLAFDLLRRWRK
jgi:hypothetical protein